MTKGNRRDTKFLIFQSLYIIAIAILFYKGTDLSLSKVVAKQDGDTLVNVSQVPSALDTVVPKTVKVYDPATQEVIKKTEGDTKMQPVSTKDTVINKQTIDKLESRISELERLKTPTRQRSPSVSEPPKNPGTYDWDKK